MAKYSLGPMGPFSGKVGILVGSSWRGINYMRSIPKKSKKAPTSQQLAHRAKFKTVVSFLRPLRSLLNAGYVDPKGQQSGINLAVAEVLANATQGDYPDYTIDFGKVLFSKGTLNGAWNLQVDVSQSGKMRLSWVDNSGSGIAHPNDQLVALAYQPDKGLFVYHLEDGALRSAGEQEMQMPAEFAGSKVHLWTAFRSSDGSVFSTSVYAGEFTLA